MFHVCDSAVFAFAPRSYLPFIPMPHKARPQLEQYARVWGTFSPDRRDDLVPEAADWIGCRLVWQASWLIEDGPYEGQWAMCIVRPGFMNPLPPFAWVPLCDLDDVVLE